MEVDNQILSDFRYCPTRGFYRHVLSRVPKARTVATSFGSAMHKGIEIYEKTGRNIEKGVLAFGKDYASLDGIDKIRTLEKGEELLRAYHRQFCNDGWECLVVETKFKIEIAEDVVYVGKIDQLGKMGEFGLGVKDIKTSTQPWNYVYTPNDQFTGYLLGGQAIMGKECENFWLDLLGVFASSKEGFRKKKDGGVESVLQRVHIQRTESQLERFVENAVAWARLVEAWSLQGRAPMNTDNCNGKYGPCPYHTICSSPPEKQQSLLEELYVEERWLPGGPDGEKGGDIGRD